MFQFTPLREGRPARLRLVCPAVRFNSRPCVRGDEPVNVPEMLPPWFQFTPLREGRHV